MDEEKDVESVTSGGHTGNDSKEKLFVENTPLYTRMSRACHVMMFLYSTAFWIQVGVYPFLIKKLGVSTVTYGYLETFAALATILPSPLFGRFGDRFGAKAAMMLCFTGSFVFYFFLAIADDVNDLILSRMAGVFMHAFHGAQMIMTDVSGTRDRADALSKISISYGLGIVVGPTLGGWLTTLYSEQFAAGVAASLMILALVFVFVVVPSQTKDPRRIAESQKKNSSQTQEGGLLNMKAVVSLLSIPEVSYLIILKTVVGIPVGVFHSMFSIVSIERFGLTPQTNGYLLTYTGILTAIMQAVGVGFFTRRFPSDLKILRISIIFKALSYFCLAWINDAWLLAICFIPMVLSGALMNAIANSTLTKNVPETATGTSLGLSMATHSIIRTFSPTMGAYMYSTLGYSSLGLFGFIMNAGVAILINAHHPPGIE